MTSRVVFTWRDFSDEYASAAFFIDTPSGAAFDWDAYETDIDGLRVALAAITAGSIAKQMIVAVDEVINDTRPATPWAQREMKWLVRYQDTVTDKHYTMTIPCAALEIMSDGGDDQLDIVGITVAATFVTWLEAHALSPEGNGMNVTSMGFVGRNT